MGSKISRCSRCRCPSPARRGAGRRARERAQPRGREGAFGGVGGKLPARESKAAGGGLGRRGGGLRGGSRRRPAAAYAWWELRSLLAPGGAYVTTLPGPGLLLGKALSWTTGTRCEFVSTVPRRKDLELLARWVSEGMRPAIDSTFPVRDLRAALERMKGGGMRGRVVIEVQGGF
ncbi:MAG: zinc-binding dehydrogenase [Deltaproteobacteria bacterium]|nr:zinc-binding dehydrogenase [Deltaproteobacteria bacterium]